MSGIVRKVDELGRIVIPKELRKNLSIKNSDDLEITIENDKIILEKFYRLRNLKDTLKKYFYILEKFLNSNFIITDKECILFKSQKNDNSDNEKLTYNYVELINLRKQYSGNDSLKITDKLDIKENYYFYPIIVNADALGSIVLYDDKKISDRDKLVSEIILFLLKEKLE